MELAIHRRVSSLKYHGDVLKLGGAAHVKQGLPPAQGMEIGYIVKDAHKWEVDTARTESEFDAGYNRGLLEEGLGEAAFVFGTHFEEKISLASPCGAKEIPRLGPLMIMANDTLYQFSTSFQR